METFSSFAGSLSTIDSALLKKCMNPSSASTTSTPTTAPWLARFEPPSRFVLLLSWRLRSCNLELCTFSSEGGCPHEATARARCLVQHAGGSSFDGGIGTSRAATHDSAESDPAVEGQGWRQSTRFRFALRRR